MLGQLWRNRRSAFLLCLDEPCCPNICRGNNQPYLLLLSWGREVTTIFSCFSASILYNFPQQLHQLFFMVGTIRRFKGADTPYTPLSL